MNEEWEVGEEMNVGNTFQVEVTVKIKMLIYVLFWKLCQNANYNAGKADNAGDKLGSNMEISGKHLQNLTYLNLSIGR